MKKITKAKRSATKIVVVIPTLNESKAVGKVLSGIKEAMTNYNHRVLIVDGRSSDGTDQIAKDMGADVIYQRGKGYGDALKTGFLYARKQLNANIIVMMDADMTYDPKHIPELVEPILKDESDMVVGNRFAGMEKGAMPLVNRFGNRMLSLVAKLALGLSVFDTQSGMRAFKSELLERMNLVAVGMPLAMEILAEAHSADARIREVPISYSTRVGETKLNPLKDGGRILGVTLRLMLDIRPLLFFGGIGTSLGVLGLIFHYLALPIELAHILFPLLLIIGGILLFWFGFGIFLIRKLRKRNGKHDNKSTAH
ncbi:MAG: glycosyltransferase family 2 protein [Candidatus Bathyarchaeota archaeon]|nr:glycosyltransferase family 2 protein [Candidatus Bathyarchaeum sp.]